MRRGVYKVNNLGSMQTKPMKSKQEKPQTFILSGMDKNNRWFYYTGKAGDEFISTDVNQAFKYQTKMAAEVKRIWFNEAKLGQLHWMEEMVG